MLDIVRLSVAFLALLGIPVSVVIGWGRWRLAVANRDPRIPRYQFSGFEKTHFTPAGWTYARQAFWCWVACVICSIVGLVLGLLGRPL